MTLPWAQLLACVGVDVKDVIALAGSSEARCGRHAGRVYKAGPKAHIEAEVGRLQTLRAAAAERSGFFVEPVLHVGDGAWWLYSTPDLGCSSLDALMAEVPKASDPGHLTARIERAMRAVLDNLSHLHTASRAASQSGGAAFAQELVQAIAANVARAGLVDLDVASLAQNAHLFAKGFYPSLLHRDLSTINVFVTGPSDDVVCIDPRCAVPNLDGFYTLGSVGFDIAGLDVATRRRQAACERQAASVDSTPVLAQLDAAQAQCIDMQASTAPLQALMHVAWWSAYAACRCDFCLAPERVWLYEDAIWHLRDSVRAALAFCL